MSGYSIKKTTAQRNIRFLCRISGIRISSSSSSRMLLRLMKNTFSIMGELFSTIIILSGLKRDFAVRMLLLWMRNAFLHCSFLQFSWSGYMRACYRPLQGTGALSVGLAG